MEFNNINVSTKTIIAVSNIGIDIQKVFMHFPLDKENEEVKINTIYYGGEKRGQEMMEKKKKKKSFRNAINVIAEMKETNKKINFKVSKNGKFQLTGCKSEDQAFKIVSYFIEQLYINCKNYITLSKNQTISIYYQTVMTNIDFNLGFEINRQKLDQFMNQQTHYHSLLETSCGYTGVNIKFQLEMKWWELPIPTMSCNDLNVPFQWNFNNEPLNQIIEITTEKRLKKKYNTFLVFHSGNIIMSGMTLSTMNKDFDIFIDLLKKWRMDIEEKIIEN